MNGELRIFISAVLTVLAGCENGMRDMYDQPKYKPLAASTLWEDGRASRPLEPGTVIHSEGALAGTSSGRLGATVSNDGEASFTAISLQRGRERYDIYCSPCHGLKGDGDGYVSRRGFPRPPSYHNEQLRSAPDLHFYQVITNGYGTMYPYADRLSPDDRWAVVAYVRALQLSQHAALEQVPAGVRMRMELSR
jgi:mono/diheme cytochrome c family protein